MNSRKIFSGCVALFALAGCASSMPMNGGLVDDHEATLAQCGVGNYTFRHLNEKCRTGNDDSVAAAPAVSLKAMQSAAPVEASKVAHLVGNQIEINEAVTFHSGSSKITKSGMKVLDEVAAVISANHAQIEKINIEGHTDATGNPSKNLSLSEARADSVKQYLAKKGIDSGKMTAKGYGQTKPKFNSATASKSELSANRRVEFNIETSKN